MSLLNGQHSCFIFGRSWFETPAWKSDIKDQDFHGWFQPVPQEKFRDNTSNRARTYSIYFISSTLLLGHNRPAYRHYTPRQRATNILNFV
jgi:hypothetical protein